jgi:hypothetical protein
MIRATSASAIALLSALLVACCQSAPPTVVRPEPAGLEEQRGIVRAAFEGADLKADTEAAGRFREGLRSSVSAAWWGFDADDATASLQASLDSGAQIVVVPAMGRPWVTGPLLIRSHTTLVLEEGAEILAKEGGFQKDDASLIALKNVEDVSIYGYGARLAMRKGDYRKAPYQKSQWRHAIEMYGCTRISVLGLTAESSGGDGVYLGRGDAQTYNSQVLLRDLLLRDHYRQGISVISAQDLRIQNVEMSFTEGTLPSAGIDFEPNYADERIVRCVLSNCIIRSNSGPGISAVLRTMDATSADIDIRVEDSFVSGSPISFLVFGAGKVGGRILFVNTKLHGLQLIGPSHRVEISGN